MSYSRPFQQNNFCADLIWLDGPFKEDFKIAPVPRLLAKMLRIYILPPSPGTLGSDFFLSIFENRLTV
jgi:hypothetical protein